MRKLTLSLLLTHVVVAAACLARPPRAAGARRAGVARAAWTVMLYMNGDNDLDRFALADFEEMAKVRYGPRVNVVVQLDRIGGANTDESWGETRRFLMREKLTPTRSNSLPGFSEESNMGDPATLTSFVTWARASYPAERYMLVIWSHGDGWRRMLREGPSDESAAARARAGAEVDELLMRGQLTDSKLASMNLLQTSLEPQYRTISEDETNGFDKLYVREIQDALEGVFKGGDGLEVIGFDACLMQMIETAYAMRNVARVMVGSEELEPLPGWRYDDWLQALSDIPSMNGEEVGRAVVESYRKNYERVKPNTTLSAVKLSGDNMGRLATAVSALARELMADLEAELPRITQARESCFTFAPRRGYHGVDLHRFCSQLAASGVNARLRARAEEVKALVDSMTVGNYAGPARRAQFGSAGLAIYFPANNAAYQDDKFKKAYTDENEFQAVRFVREHLWDNFLHAYFKRV
ncbi:MAG TPA: clostripain-related cysteine peptidase [Pyrinomonadaceae bacterium]